MGAPPVAPDIFLIRADLTMAFYKDTLSSQKKCLKYSSLIDAGQQIQRISPWKRLCTRFTLMTNPWTLTKSLALTLHTMTSYKQMILNK